MEQSKIISKPKISVIVPVYKGEKYIKECIDSILRQSFRDLELLLLDDGSPDGCGKICDFYASKDSRVRVFHQENQGINRTRRNGVKVAKGEWISFVDDDDTLVGNALESLYGLHEETDLVIGYPYEPKEKYELTLDDFKSNAITAKMFAPCPWAKLYKKELLSDDVFDFPREIDGEEDMIMNIRVMFKIKKSPRLLSKKIYNFRRNTASVSHTKKCSVEHEMLFDNVRRASISSEDYEKYIKEIIWSRLNGLYPVAFSNPKSFKKSPYVDRIKSDIKKFHYSLNFSNYLLLNCHLTFVLKIIGFLELLKRSLRYRFFS